MKNKSEIFRYYQEEKDLLEISKGERGDGSEFFDEADPDIRKIIPEDYRRSDFKDMPELSEVQVVRHFTRLSSRNFCVDNGLYPLGSCTMKYNPKINDRIAGLKGFEYLHPYSPENLSQGAIEILYLAGQYLSKITGMDAATVMPSAGAQGEFVGMRMIMAYHKKTASKKDIVLIPDSAHGTNPASSALCGYRVQEVKSNEKGLLSVEEIKRHMNDQVAGIMVTNPNTLGIFEENITEIARIIHDAGGLVYCDGANLNALMGLVDFKAMGIDAMHINLHKTFSTPHGGGGPGSGPVVVVDRLKDFLPVPLAVKDKNGFTFKYDLGDSIGRVKPFFGNFAIIVRALAYILSLGEEGLKRAREDAVLNANYIKAGLKDVYHLPYDTPSLHEAVFSEKFLKENGISTLDVAKRLMDFGFHPPTVYFPLIVKGAIMIEPTETESREDLDRFVETMRTIAREAKENPEMLHGAPNNLGIKRLDEVYAAKNPKLTWSKA